VHFEKGDDPQEVHRLYDGNTAYCRHDYLADRGLFHARTLPDCANIPAIVAEWLVGLPFNRYLIMVMILVFYEIGGSFIDDLAFVILATPVLYPAVVKLGFDPIWFGYWLVSNS